MSAYTLLWCLTVLLEACSVRAQHSETRTHDTYGLDVRQDGLCAYRSLWASLQVVVYTPGEPEARRTYSPSCRRSFQPSSPTFWL